MKLQLRSPQSSICKIVNKQNERTTPVVLSGVISNCIQWSFLLTISVFLSACEKEDTGKKNEENGKDREVLLTRLADSLVIPAYDGFKKDLDVMLAASVNFTTNPDQATLTAFRAAWQSAYVKWQTVELFDFGPAETYTLRNFYNIYPADTNGIKANFKDPSANLEVPASYPKQGFPALDYLLNGVGNSDASILSYYKDPTSGAQRLAYITRLANRMKSLLEQVVSDWKGTYRDRFISRTSLDIGSSTSLMVNGVVLHYERFIRSGKIGIPSGAMLNGTVAPDKVEAFYKRDLSKTLAIAANQAYTDFFNGKSYLSGTEGASLKTYIDALGAKDAQSGKMLSTLINEQLNLVDARLKPLDNDFYQQINTNNAAVKDVFEQMQAVVRMLKVDMTSAMSITITYTDNDGD